MADIAGATLREVSISNSTDTTDIPGSFEQVDGNARARNLIQHVLDLSNAYVRSARGSSSRLKHEPQLRRLIRAQAPIDSTSLQNAMSILDQLPEVDAEVKSMIRYSAERLSTSIATEGRFEWVDGPLVRTLKEDDWLLLDNANLYNPSVSDRLNALCQPGGVLDLNEQGIVNGAVPLIIPSSRLPLDHVR